MLICPICKEALVQENKSLHCRNNHCFDLAKAGYVNLSRKQKESGDSQEAVKARTRFLEKGYYTFLLEQLEAILKEIHPDILVDIGCGQGWYTKKLAETARQTYGFDLSRPAIQYAARQDKTSQYVVASIYDLPLPAHCADAVVSIFTPIPEEEISRILKPDGYFIQVSPAPRHLWELKELLYDTVYENEETPGPGQGFVLQGKKEISRQILVENVYDLFEMTPYRYHSPYKGVEKVKNSAPLKILFAFEIRIWRKQTNDEEEKSHHA